MRATPARLLMLVALVGLCGAGLVTQAYKRFQLYRSPYAEPLPWGPGGEPLTERLVICLVDGLRVDASRTMPALNALRKQGADWTLTVTEPTSSIPLSHVISTGAPQTTIGLLHNATPIGVGFYTTFGTIYTAAHDAGLRTGNVVTWRPDYPLKQYLDAPNSLPGAPGYADDDDLVGRVRDVLAEPDAPNLLWVHFDIVDRAGHLAGAASDAYRETVRLTDERIGEIAAAMDLERETLLVTADHGHTDLGGHGGGEPEVAAVPCVLAGAGVAPGTAGDGAQVDLASTIAWLLGTAVPPHNEGWPLADALTVSAEQRARRARDTLAQMLAAYRFRTERLGIADRKLEAPPPHGLRTDLVDERIAQSRWDDAWAAAANLAKEVTARWKAWQAHVGERRLQPRVYAAAGSAALALGLSIVLRRRAVARGAPPAKNPPLWLVAGVLVGIGLPIAIFLLPGNTYSMSVLGRRGLLWFTLPRLGEGALGLMGGYAAARLLAPRAAPAPPVGTYLAGVAGGIAGVAAVGAGVYLVGWGLNPQPWHTSFRPLAILIVGGMQFIAVAGLAFVSAIVVAIRTRNDVIGDGSPPRPELSTAAAE